MLIGYARVNTDDQDFTLRTLKQASCRRSYEESSLVPGVIGRSCRACSIRCASTT